MALKTSQPGSKSDDVIVCGGEATVIAAQFYQ
jgi:hypothetical protein